MSESAGIAGNATTTKPKPPSARFFDLIVLVFLFILGLAFLSFIYYRGSAGEVEGAERAVRSLRERDATLQEKLDNTMAMAQLDEADARVAHPALLDRNANFIGDHADVSWTYGTKSDRNYISYEVELWRNQPGNCSLPNADGKKILQTINQLFWAGCSNGPVKFVASDPSSMSSRIPPNLDDEMQSGNYSWRVAPIRAASNVDPEDDDAELLSDWSELSSFNIHKSLLHRITETHIVRVGTNFEQDTHFSRRDEGGHEVGFDISLVRTLVEGCLELTESGIRYSASECAKAVAAARAANFKDGIADSTCRPFDSPTKLCVKFVPVGSWGKWQSILKRKEIDLFIGSVTRAAARERAGIVFTDGYLNYQTKLYVHKTDLVRRPLALSNWLSKDRVVGVIESSTNEYLLDHLIEEDFKSTLDKKSKLHKFPVRSYPALESAMERGDLDGIIIDDSFVSKKQTDWVTIPDLVKTNAWQTYTSEYVGPQPDGGAPAEQIAIATIQDETDSNRGLYSALQTALKKKEIRAVLLPALCQTFLASSNNSCPVGGSQ
jgi:hypothetical protein